MKFEIKHRFSGAVLFSCEANSIKEAVEAAVKSGADLRYANLVDADLRGADLRDAKLLDANLGFANLVGANLVGAKLLDANLVGANLGFAIETKFINLKEY